MQISIPPVMPPAMMPFRNYKERILWPDPVNPCLLYLVAAPCIPPTTGCRRHHVSPGRGEESLHELDVGLRHDAGPEQRWQVWKCTKLYIKPVNEHLISARKNHELMLLVCFCVMFCKWRGIFLWSCLFLFLDVPQRRSRSKWKSWRLMIRWLSEFRTVCPPHNERCPGQEVKPCHGAGSHCSCDQVKFIFPNLNSNTTSNCLETSFHAPLRLLHCLPW